MPLILCPVCKCALDELARACDAKGVLVHCRREVVIPSVILDALAIYRPQLHGRP